MYSHKEAIEEGWGGWSRQQRNSKLTTSIIVVIVWVGGQPQGTEGQTLEDSKKVVPKRPSVMLQRLCVWTEGNMAAEVSLWRSCQRQYGGNLAEGTLCSV